MCPFFTGNLLKTGAFAVTTHRFRLEPAERAVLIFGVEAPAPVLNSDMVDQWFAHSAPDEQEGDRRTAAMLRKNVAPRLATLKANASSIPSPDAQRELHNLRGSVASFGFTACVRQLAELERHWAILPEAQRKNALGVACDTFDAGLTELFNRFPHLRP